jgi:hypothetical protein
MRKAQHDGPAGFRQRLADHADFVAFIRMVGDAIDLEKVDAPAREQLRHRIVIGLAGGTRAHAVVVLVPRADIRGVGHVGGPPGGIGDGDVVGHGLLRNAAHQVNAEFQSERVDVVGQRFEPGAVGGRGIAVGRRGVAAIGSQGEGRVGLLGDEPAFVDDDVLPAVAFQVLGHVSGFGADAGFVDGHAPGIPTVPTHGRGGGELRGGGECGEEKDKCETWHVATSVLQCGAGPRPARGSQSRSE